MAVVGERTGDGVAGGYQIGDGVAEPEGGQRGFDWVLVPPTTCLLRRSTVPVRPMPSSVKARRVRISAIPTVIASVLGLEAVRLRAGRLGPVSTGLGQRSARATYE